MSSVTPIWGISWKIRARVTR